MPDIRLPAILILLATATFGGCDRLKSTASGSSGSAASASASQAGAPSSSGASVDVWSEQSTAAARISRLLTPRTVAVELSSPEMPEGVRAIAEKLKQAAQLDPHAFLTAYGNASAEGPPAYSRQLGITRDEYDLLVQSHMQLKKTGAATLTIRQLDDNRFALTGLPEVKEFVIDVAIQSVSMPQGEVSRPISITPNASQRLTGPLNGFLWRETGVGGSMRRYLIQEVLLGQTAGGGDAWLAVHVRDTLENQTAFQYFARFAGPTE
jgi:hypothetical protein